MNKDNIILKLLIGWEIIYLAKKGKKLIVRLKESMKDPYRFIRISFSQCTLAVFLDFSTRQTEDFAIFEFAGCRFHKVTIENEDIVNIHLLRDSELVGAIKIQSMEILFEFTSK